MNTFQFTPYVFALGLALALGLRGVTEQVSPKKEAGTDFAAIDEYVEAQRVRLHIPGLALGIVHGDQIVHLQGFGVADSAGRSVTPQTPFYIGSVTKSFTALAVMQLVEADKMDLDAPVQNYLPWFELADKEASAKITVRHLLNQTTGLSEKDGNRFWPSQQGLEEMVRGLNTMPLTHPVGAKFEYSNINYSIAGLIVEKVSGQPYGEYVTQHIFEPLDMRHSFSSRELALADGVAEGHYYMFGRAFASEGPQPPAHLPTGFLIASVEDMTHYAIAHINGGQYADTSVLSPQGIAELHAPGLLMKNNLFHYAMGWAVGSSDGISFVRHSGDAATFHSMVILLPENGWGVVILANASGFEQLMQVDEITKNVANLLYDRQAAPVSLPFMLRFLYWGILLTPILQILGIAYALSNGQLEGWQAIVTVVLNLAIGFAFLFKIPGLIPFTLSSMRAFYPELGYALISGGILGFGWSMIRAFIYFWVQ